MPSEVLRVQLLGPVRAWRDDEPVPVRGVTGRSVLARLALEPGRVVSIGALMDALWGDDPPKRPAANLHTIVSRLRRSLHADTVETAPDGYALVGDVVTDAAELRQALGGRTAHGSEIGALRALVTAGGGLPLEGVAESVAFEPFRTMLAELRLEALDRLDAALVAAGRAPEAIPELWRRAASEPVRERTHALLAEALARAGRQAEALRVIADFRRSLGERSGLEPSSMLTKLERDILDDALSRPPTPAATSGVRSDVPVTLTPLVGRDDEVERISSLVARHRLVTLTGIGGIGKTRLAIEIASAPHVADSDTVVFVDLRPVTGRGIVEAVVDAGGFEVAESGDARHEAVARFVARRDVLVVLDNCEHIVDEVATFVNLLLTSGPRARVLATSRRSLDVQGERVHHISGLPLDDGSGAAIELLVERAVAVDDRFVLADDERPVAVELCRRLDGLPLAIEMAAAQLGHLGVADVLARLDRRFDLLIGTRGSDGGEQRLLEVMTWSWELLEERDRAMLTELSVFASSFVPDAVEAVCGASHDDPMGSLRRLVRASLVEVQRTEHGVRYRLLETVRFFAARQLAARGTVESTSRRHRDWFIERIAAATFGELSLSSSWIERFASELDDVFAAIDWSIGQRDWEAAAQLLVGGAGTWRVGARSVSALDLTERVLAHRDELDPTTRSRLLLAGSDAALAAGKLRRVDELGRSSLEAARAVDDPDLLALALAWMALVVATLDRPHALALLAEAADVPSTPIVQTWVRHNRIAIEHLPRLGEPMPLDLGSVGPTDSVVVGGSRLLVALNDAFGGRLDDALEHVRWLDAHGPFASPIRNQPGVPAALVHALAGDPDSALAEAARARAALDRVSETLWRGELVLALAAVRRRTGDPERALSYLERTRTMLLNYPLTRVLARELARSVREELDDDGLSSELRRRGAQLDVEHLLDVELAGLAPGPRHQAKEQ